MPPHVPALLPPCVRCPLQNMRQHRKTAGALPARPPTPTWRASDNVNDNKSTEVPRMKHADPVPSAPSPLPAHVALLVLPPPAPAPHAGALG